MNKKYFFLLISILSCISLIFADSNGIWVDAQDIRSGSFGSDETGVQSFNFTTSLGVDTLFKIANPSYVLDLSGNSVLGRIYPAEIRTPSLIASSLVDLENSSYYVNPSLGANIRNVDVEDVLRIKGEDSDSRYINSNGDVINGNFVVNNGIFEVQGNSSVDFVGNRVDLSSADVYIDGLPLSNFLTTSCTDNVWGPAAADVCSGTAFNQTSNCGNTQVVIGTRNCTPPPLVASCVDTTWVPSEATYCSGDSFTQLSNCGTSRIVNGTKLASIWPAEPKDICSNLGPVNQTALDCSNQNRTIVGTKNCGPDNIIGSNTFSTGILGASGCADVTVFNCDPTQCSVAWDKIGEIGWSASQTNHQSFGTTSISFGGQIQSPSNSFNTFISYLGGGGYNANKESYCEIQWDSVDNNIKVRGTLITTNLDSISSPVNHYYYGPFALLSSTTWSTLN